MAEVIGLVASIVQVAAFGLTLSRTLHDYGASVVGAEKRLKGLDKDIEFTSRIISQLATSLGNTQVQALVAEDTIRLTQDVVAECDAIFQAMEDVVTRIRNSGIGKWTIYFKESKIELMRANLDRMKGNLQLLMGVIIHGTQMANEQPDDALVAAHRAKIRELMLEKEYYTQRYLEEKRRYDDLLAKVNSTSTLNSVLTVNSVDDSRPKHKHNTLSQERHCGTASPGPNLAPPNAVTSQTTSTDSSNIPTFTVSSQALPDLATVGSLGIGAQFSMGGSARLSLSSRDITANEAEASASPGRQTQGAPSATPMPQVLPNTPASSSALEIGETRRRKRDSMAKAAKKTAQAASIAAGVAVGVAIFPIAIPWYVLRRQRKLRVEAVVSPPAAPATPSVPSPGDLSEPWEQASPFNAGYSGYWQHHQTMDSFSTRPFYMQPQQYASAQLPAELPAIHELSDVAVPVELDLLNRLTRHNFPPLGSRDA